MLRVGDKVLVSVAVVAERGRHRVVIECARAPPAIALLAGGARGQLPVSVVDLVCVHDRNT